MIALLFAGLAALGLGGAVSASGARLKTALRMQSAGCAAIGAAGFWAFAGGGSSGAAFTSDLTPHAGIDALTGLFLGTLGLVATLALAFASDYLPATRQGRATAVLGAAFTLALVGVLCARDALTFLACWEMMTLIPAAIVLIRRSDDAGRQTVFTYVAITHLGGAGTWIALLLLAHEGAIGDGSALVEGSGIQAVIAVAAIVGFGTKAGLMPLHTWLPRTHPEAPAHISALMSGVMISVSAYGLLRVLVEWLGSPPAWIGALVLALGAASAVGGITCAIFQRDLKRLLAYSSVEHMGLVALGLGACLLLRAGHADTWAAFALGAALLHVVNHAMFKSLLFLAAGSFERSAGRLDVDRLGGLLRRMPWTGGAFLVGCLAIAGMPLLNGFASEWLLLQSLLHVTAFGGVWDGVLGALALAALAATVALGALCFVKVIGLVLLGPSRTADGAQATEAPATMRGAVIALAATCVVLGAVPGLLFHRLVELAPWGAAEVPARPGLLLPGTGGLPTAGIACVLLGIATVAWLARGTRRSPAAATWACGQAIEPSLRWTSAGFSKPLRLMLEPILRPQREIEVRTQHGVVQEVAYSSRMPDVIDDYLYRPVTRGGLAAAGWTRRLQSGRLGTYVAYLIGLVVALLFAVRIGLVG